MPWRELTVPGSRRSPFHRVVHLLTTSEQQRDAEHLRRVSVEAGRPLAANVRRGEYVSLCGRLRTVVYAPRTNLPALEADLYDGSGVVTLVWLGRRRIAGIEPGRSLTVRGRVALRDGQKVLYNPYYELAPPAGWEPT